MDLARIAAFADGDVGGNPAGVVLAEVLPDPASMQRIAAEIGYSETAFAAPDGDGWRVRYYAPAAEVPFCGHATIALGSVLGGRFGAGRYALSLRDAAIVVEAAAEGEDWLATLTSPPTTSAPLAPALARRLMALFALAEADLDPRLPPALAEAGARHAVFALSRRQRLSAMAYPFAPTRALMLAEGLTTISLLWIESPTRFHARNAFAAGGVVEDPATGAAAAALGGLLVDRAWPLGPAGRFRLRQGEDMGAPSEILVDVTGQPGAPVRVTGRARRIG